MLSVALLAAACGDDSVSLDAFPMQMAFRTVGGGTAGASLPTVEVELRNANGELVPTAINRVAVELEANPGNWILHVSGIADDDRVVEVISLYEGYNVVAPPLSTDEGDQEALALEYVPETGVMYLTARIDSLYTVDLEDGSITAVGWTGDADRIKGLAFDASAGVLIGAQRSRAALLTIDPATADTSNLGDVTIAGDTIEGFTGLDRDPTSGELYAVAKLASGPRALVTLDASTLVATPVSTLQEGGVAGITFLTDGTLLAVTGDGATNPEQLWTVNVGTGAMTSVLALGNGADGESIEAVPAILSGTLEVLASEGVARFDDLTIDTPGGGFTLRATSQGVSDATSEPFDVTN